MLDTHLNQKEVDTMVKNNKQTFQDFYDPILIPSQTRGIMVLLRKSCPFKLVNFKEVSYNCLSVKLESTSKQELEIAFVYNPNDEADNISNNSKALDQMSSNGCKNHLIIGDYNTSLNPELDYVDYTQDPHKASREFLHGLQEDGHFIDVFRFLSPFDLSYTWIIHNSKKRSELI